MRCCKNPERVVGPRPGLVRFLSSDQFTIMSTVNDVEIAELQLSQKDRWHLASRILGSLPPPPDSDAPDSILAEAQLRDAELENGTIKPLSESEFWRGVRGS